MTLQEITTKMKEGASKKSAFGNSVKFATDLRTQSIAARCVNRPSNFLWQYRMNQAQLLRPPQCWQHDTALPIIRKP